ncbi:hypothetical protein MKW94_022323 [Papaver nudicaule]|uniref:3'-5' exonuclease domain-containing protein n=1 Tax=Papaver nudicaule TaxID=74823 RepID=A0AA41VG45_PAPNU|nr:hypothetical protein [Papaver nudicaule]
MSSPRMIKRWIHRSWSIYKRSRGDGFIVGLVVQWTPSTNEASTLQLCFGTHCLVIQLSHTPSIPDVLRRFLLDENVRFVGIWNRSDNERLLNSNHKLSIGNLINMSDYAITGKPSMKNLTRLFLGYDGVPKHHIWSNYDILRSNWSARNLSIQQIEHAVVVAYVSLRVGMRFRQRF